MAMQMSGASRYGSGVVDVGNGFWRLGVSEVDLELKVQEHTTVDCDDLLRSHELVLYGQDVELARTALGMECKKMHFIYNALLF